MILMQRLRGDGLRKRIMRGAGITIFAFGASQILRLGSNLILTRLLLPEAFGVMSVITAIIIGLSMMSDMGTGPAIMQHKRGDEPVFLDTAFTIKAIRGVFLWLIAALMAWPLSLFYEEPLIASLLPVAALGLLFHGVEPTRVEAAQRHMNLVPLTIIDLGSQIISLAITILLAYLLQSVWALTIAQVLASVVRLIMLTVLLPGRMNRFAWDKDTVKVVSRFGFWLFLSSAVGFWATQGDKTVLGKYITMEMLGLYNIGFFLAAFPMMLAASLVQKMMIPIYRERPPHLSRANFEALRQMRVLLTASLFAMIAIMAFCGEWLIALLYDPRYAQSGPILVLVAVSQFVTAIYISYDQAALAAGDSRNFFLFSLWRTICTMAGLIIGVEAMGLVGATIGQALGNLMIYPVVIWLARKHGAWDWVHDLIFAIAGVILTAIAIHASSDAILALIASSW